MGTWDSGVYDCDSALDELGRVFRELRKFAERDAIVTWHGLAVWMNPPVDSEDDTLSAGLHAQLSTNTALPADARASIKAWLDDGEAFQSGSARSKKVTDVLGGYCDGPRHDALITLPEGKDLIAKLATLASERLGRALKSHMDLYELSGPMANLGILLELASAQRWVPDRATVETWKIGFDARDAATKEERDFWDEYSASVKRGFALLLEHATLSTTTARAIHHYSPFRKLHALTATLHEMFLEHLSRFELKPIVNWRPGSPLRPKKAIRISVDLDEDDGPTIVELIAALANEPRAIEVESLVLGLWSDSHIERNTVAVDALVAAKERFRSLKRLFLGDAVQNETDLSWICQGNLAAALDAFPSLECLWIRGNIDLSLGRTPTHDRLSKLVVQSAGLQREFVQEICRARFPQLAYLELWLGWEGQDGTTSIEDLTPLFAGRLFTKLKHLGLKNSELANEIAVAIANAPVLAHLETLDLSMGVLGDEGGKALLESPLVPSLKELNLHHHYMTNEVTKQLQKLTPVKVVVTGQQDEADDRYVSVCE